MEGAPMFFISSVLKWELHLLLHLQSQHLYCYGDDDAQLLQGALPLPDAQLQPDAQQLLVRDDDDDDGVELPLQERGGDDDDDGVVQLLQEHDDDDDRGDASQLCRDDDHDDAVLKLYLCRRMPLLLREW